MELKEAKYILQERKSILINSSMPDISLITAIDTVLEELNNRIPRKDIEELLEQLYRGKPLLDENGNEIGKRYEYMAIHYLENLLNKE